MKKNNYSTPVPAALLAALLALLVAALAGLAGCEQLPGGISAGQEIDDNGDGDGTPNPTPGGFTVSFDSRGGSPVASQTVAKGGAVRKPSPNPTRDGYSFAGWFTSDADEQSLSPGAW
jgi:hypothetical protein